MADEHAKELLRGRVDRFTEILYRDDPFTIRDMDGQAKRDNRAVLRTLRDCGAIVKNQRIYPEGNGGKKLIQYEWAKHQAYLQEYYENRNELPCGHRSHIPPERTEDGGYICKFCGEAVSRQAVENAL